MYFYIVENNEFLLKDNLANFSELKFVSEIPNSSYYFIYDTEGLSFIKDSNYPKEVLHVDFLTGTLGWRMKRANHERNIKKALGKGDKQLLIFDSTAGLLTDSLIFLSLGHKVIAVEQSKILYSLLRDAISRAEKKIPVLKNLMLINDNSVDAYKSISEDFDAIYIDPMFPKSKKYTKKPGKIESIKKILELENLKDDTESLIEIFLNSNYKKIILKSPLKHRNIYSNINYQVFGKTTRFDIFL